MKRLALLLLLAAAPVPLHAADVPASEAQAKNGLRVTTDLRDEYLAGFPMIVAVTVRNETDSTQVFPDLGARPHLVHFHLELAGHRTERFTSPPPVDSGATWTLSPRAQRRVLLEIPSSSGFAAGKASLTVRIHDPAGQVEVPARAIRIAAAAPVGGAAVHEPTISTTTGAMVAWLHKAAQGFDLYLHQFNPRAPARTLGQYHLAHLDAAVEPVLARARASDALSRHVYWQGGPQSWTLGRLDAYAMPDGLRTVSVPWPTAETLGRGVTDAKGGLILPIWTPAPSGPSGSVRALCVDARGGVVVREVADFPTRPAVVETAVDAGSNLLLALGHASALDIYRVDPTQPAAMPARGARVTKLTDGWEVEAVAFDTLPDQAERAGGLAMLSILRRTADGATSYRALWSELGGKVFLDSGPLPWSAPGDVATLLPAGLGPFYYLSRDAADAWWHGAQGGTPVRVERGGPGALWPAEDAIQLRRIVPGVVVEDVAVGPRAL